MVHHSLAYPHGDEVSGSTVEAPRKRSSLANLTRSLSSSIASLTNPEAKKAQQHAERIREFRDMISSCEECSTYFRINWSGSSIFDR